MDIIDIGPLSLLPPLIAIGLALWTRQVFISLFIGLWLGFIILAGGNPITGLWDLIDGLVAVFEDAGNTRIILFTLIMGALIALIQRSGGVQGFINVMMARLEAANGRGQRVRVELLALMTGLLIFIESNISILTVGTLYRPVFDKLKIPREKLAYLADSTSSPSCILMPFNAWGAYIAGLLMAQGIENGFSALLKATLYNVYPMLVILGAVWVIISGRDFGDMAKAEARLKTSGALHRDGAQPMMAEGTVTIDAKDGVAPRAINMLIPLLTLIIAMPCFLIWTGWAAGGGEALTALQNGSGSRSVLYATVLAVFMAAGLNKAQGLLGLREMVDISLKAMGGMVPLAMLMLFAFALGTLCRELGTGAYAADITRQFLSPGLIPALVFLMACFIAFSTGTSWGTFAIMIVIAVPLAQQMDLNLSLVIAAALGGGIFGDHCSPTSDTSIISSMASGTDHIDHIRTQLPYALIAGTITTVIYLILGISGL
jgi:Na+/H+ antiporter NhaC